MERIWFAYYDKMGFFCLVFDADKRYAMCAIVFHYIVVVCDLWILKYR